MRAEQGEPWGPTLHKHLLFLCLLWLRSAVLHEQHLCWEAAQEVPSSTGLVVKRCDSAHKMLHYSVSFKCEAHEMFLRIKDHSFILLTDVEPEGLDKTRKSGDLYFFLIFWPLFFFQLFLFKLHHMLIFRFIVVKQKMPWHQWLTQ